MAPVTKTESSSYSSAMAQIYTLFQEMGLNQAQLVEDNNKTQIFQTDVTKAETEANHASCQKYIDDMAQEEKQMEEAKKWSFWGDVLKYTVTGVGILAAGLLSETGLGFAIMAGVAIFCATPLFQKMTSTIGNSIGDMLGGSPAEKTIGNVLAQVLVVAVATIATAGAEGISIGTKTAATDAVKEGTQVVANAAAKAGEKAAEEAAEEAATDATSSTTSTTDNTATTQGYRPRFSGAAYGSGVNAASASGLLQNIARGICNLCTLNTKQSKGKEIAEGIITALAGICAFIAGAYFGGANTNNLSQMFGEYAAKLQMVSRVTQAGGQFALGGVNIANGVVKLNLSNTENEIAPLPAQMSLIKALINMTEQTSDTSSKGYQSLIQGYQGLYKMDFAAPSKAVNEILA